MFCNLWLKGPVARLYMNGERWDRFCPFELWPICRSVKSFKSWWTDLMGRQDTCERSRYKAFVPAQSGWGLNLLELFWTFLGGIIFWTSKGWGSRPSYPYPHRIDRRSCTAQTDLFPWPGHKKMRALEGWGNVGEESRKSSFLDVGATKVNIQTM